MTRKQLQGGQQEEAEAERGQTQKGAGKRAVAEAAAGWVVARAEERGPDALFVGLGSGSTAELFLSALAEEPERIANLRGIPTSTRTEEVARGLGIPVVELEDGMDIDIAVDGTDEIDEELNLIKGGGGALLREKIVATYADEFVVMAEDHKFVHRLGRIPLPVEVVPFGVAATEGTIRGILEYLDLLDTTTSLKLRMAGDQPYVTDNGNLILDIKLGPIEDPWELESSLNIIPGIVDCGLFCLAVDQAMIGHENGTIDILTPDEEEDPVMAWWRKKRGPRSRLS